MLSLHVPDDAEVHPKYKYTEAAVQAPTATVPELTETLVPKLDAAGPFSVTLLLSTHVSDEEETHS